MQPTTLRPSPHTPLQLGHSASCQPSLWQAVLFFLLPFFSVGWYRHRWQRSLLCSALLLCLATTLHAQDYAWAKSIGDFISDKGRAIAVDHLGNVYITGSFRGIVDFDPGPGTTELSSAGNNDIFVCKFDASGNFVWAKSMGGSDDDQGNAIAVDHLGNVYTTGVFSGTADFDPSDVGTAELESVGDPDSPWPTPFSDIFVSKLDASGNYVWARRMGGGI